MRTTIHSLVQRATHLISLPTLVIKLNQVIASPNSTLDEISQLLQQDPALSMRLLKIVNSPYYGMTRRVDTIHKAISFVGLRDLRDLVLSTSIVHSLKGLRNPFVTLENFWRHSVFCAVIARITARLRRESQPERFFIGGLLHDIGSLLLYQFLPEESARIIQRARNTEVSLALVESDILGWTSADLGADIAKHWNLPASLEAAIRYHAAPERAPDFLLEATTVHVAKHLANSMDNVSNRLSRIDPINLAHWDTLKLSPTILNTSRQEIISQFEEVSRLIVIDTLAA